MEKNIFQEYGDEPIIWLEEGAAVISDIEDHVGEIYISKCLDTKSQVFFNLKTLEGDKYCIRLSPNGFKIVAREYDKNYDNVSEEVYETPYALLNQISSKYSTSFGNQLCQELFKLKENDE